MAELQKITDLEQAFYELEKIKQHVNMLSDFLLSKIKANGEVKQQTSGMIDPRTGLPFGQTKKGGGMAHSKELIALVKEDVTKSYNPLLYDYIIEKKLNGSKKRVYPDIQVALNNEVICAVEIGYTRPEKLKYYHDYGVKDVRWYDKKGYIRNSQLVKNL